MRSITRTASADGASRGSLFFALIGKRQARKLRDELPEAGADG